MLAAIAGIVSLTGIGAHQNEVEAKVNRRADRSLDYPTTLPEDCDDIE